MFGVRNRGDGCLVPVQIGPGQVVVIVTLCIVILPGFALAAGILAEDRALMTTSGIGAVTLIAWIVRRLLGRSSAIEQDV